MEEIAAVESEKDCFELRPRRITAPQRYSCYEELPSSEDDDTQNGTTSLKRRKKTQKQKNVEVPFSSESSDQAVLNCDDSSSHAGKSSLINDLLTNKDEENKRYGANAYVCPECGKVLRSKDTLLRHRISHSGLKPFLCKVCDQGFSSAVSLKEHNARHDNKKLYECKICFKSFRQNSCYHRHMATHSQNSPHVCQLCNKRFSLKDYLRSHMKTHTTEKRYACDQCTKAFARVSDLNRHKILHTSARPYRCTVCGISFADSSSCRRHMKDHDATNKVQRHQCGHCTSSFKKSSLLTQHLLKKHKISPTATNTQDSSVVSESNSNILQVVDVTREQSFNEENLLLSENALPCPELAEQIPCKQPFVNKAPLYATEDCNAYLISNTYNDNFLSVQTTSTVFKVVAPEIDISNCDTTQELFYSEVEPVQKSQVQLSFQEEVLTQPRVDYIAFPDFHSQDYYTWLAGFNSVCKLLPFPLDTDLFTKISQVQKSIVDTLAEPSDLLSLKSNFKALRVIGEDLCHVINGHLDFTYDHLKE